MKKVSVLIAAFMFMAPRAFAVQPSHLPFDVTMTTSTSETGFNAGSGYYYDVDSSNPGGTIDYLVVFTQANPGAVDFFEEFDVPVNTPIDITIDNDPFSGGYLDSGYYLSPTLIPLDNLNFGTTPPPSLGSSPYTPLPNLDGSISGSASETILPVPASIWGGLFMMVVVGVMELVRRLRREI